MSVLIYYTILQGILFVKPPQSTREVWVSFDRSNDALSSSWYKMIPANDSEKTFSLSPPLSNCTRKKRDHESIITFKVRYVFNDNSSAVSDWTSALYDIDLIEICYSSVVLTVFASFIIIIGFIYMSIFLTNHVLLNCKKTMYG